MKKFSPVWGKSFYGAGLFSEHLKKRTFRKCPFLNCGYFTKFLFWLSITQMLGYFWGHIFGDRPHDRPKNQAFKRVCPQIPSPNSFLYRLVVEFTKGQAYVTQAASHRCSFGSRFVSLGVGLKAPITRNPAVPFALPE